MAVYKLFPEKDATIYSLFPTMNTGLDEILDLTNLNFAISSSAQVARFLIKFDQDQITNTFDTLIGDKDWTAALNLYIATAQSINLDYYLEVFPVYGSWGMGTGKYLDSPISTNGVSWRYQNYANGTSWPTGSWITIPYVSMSYQIGNKGGGAWYTGSDSGITLPITQSFNYRSDKDLNVDVKSIVTAWSSSEFANEGFLIKWEDSIEWNSAKAVQPVLQYYSVDTNTIYPPVLEFKWKDSTWDTGSSTTTVVSTDNLYVSIPENQGFFYSESIQRFRINCRPKYPEIVFQTSSLYTTNYYLPSGSAWYAVKDLDTNEYVIDFDNTYTAMSADDQSNYFFLYMNGLQPERYYTILIKYHISGSTYVEDSNYNFKVING
jgi:hypothetical protein